MTYNLKPKDVARHWNDFQNNLIDQQEIVTRIKNYPEWYDDVWKTMKSKRDCWTGISGDNLKTIAVRNGLEDDYKSLYKITSKFVHISPLLSNYYSIQGNGPICNEAGVFEMTYIGLSQFIETYALAFQTLGIDSDLLKGSLHIPLTILSKS